MFGYLALKKFFLKKILSPDARSFFLFLFSLLLLPLFFGML